MRNLTEQESRVVALEQELQQLQPQAERILESLPEQQRQTMNVYLHTLSAFYLEYMTMLHLSKGLECDV